jgi:predicted enzyme related to lactoylglutathione lyase
VSEVIRTSRRPDALVLRQLADAVIGQWSKQILSRSAVRGRVALLRTKLEHVRANVSDLHRAVEWYQDTLGFEVESYWPPDNPNYADFETAGGATFAVMEAGGRGARFNFTVDDPDELWERLKDNVTVIEPLFDTPYGTRKFTIADPDGNELGFVRNS